MQAFDRMLGRRTLLFALAVTCLALVVVVLTDEPESSAGMRLARLAAMGPAFAALSSWVVLSQVRHRGELRALEAIGASPWRTTLGATVAGWLIGVLSLAVFCLPLTDVQSLFPILPQDCAWRLDGDDFLEPIRGLRLAPDGSLESAGPKRGSPSVVDSRPKDALMFVGPLAIVLPVWVTAPASALSRLAACSIAAALAVVLLHLVASERAPAVSLVGVATPLFVQVSAQYLGSALRRT
jgi:hypothetical protein